MLCYVIHVDKNNNYMAKKHKKKFFILQKKLNIFIKLLL